ncbi:peptide methionine sulfoxide reductase-like [Diaphorina citri]|uniref:peptide-methionine (S)-S-oxide reductase n=1 Tax=Diaphorina citri TaxID=121845 RepID=A0A3Q0ILR3_DIACI|nr:peptide methionine sulfoxide reductase-like [Diaphorina citri]
MSQTNGQNNTKTAVLAMGCFWAPDGLFGTTKGVLRTKVGYSGGTTENPTYRNIGDHTEVTQVDYKYVRGWVYPPK